MRIITSITEHSDYLHSLRICMSERWSLHRKRVNFGKQLTELWMFIPVGFDGNVLELPGSAPIYTHSKEYIQKWNEARKRCLFEGFSICDRMEEGEKIDCIMYNDEHFLLKSIIGKTIEEIVKHQFELTPTALKTIGL